jgi:hypothetical protein
MGLLFISLPRMAALVLLLEVADRKFGVVLEGFEGVVAEQFLDVVHAGAPTQEFGGATAAEGVRGHVDGRVGAPRHPVNQAQERVIRALHRHYAGSTPRR